MCARLEDNIPLARIADACGLSLSHFARAFKQSTGLPPHRWLLQQRIYRSQDLLLHSDMPLSEIAIACGFSDQSHLNRVFVRVAGISPGAWRLAPEPQVRGVGFLQPSRTRPPGCHGSGPIAGILERAWLKGTASPAALPPLIPAP